MSQETETTFSILNHIWALLAVPLGWLFTKQNSLEKELDEHQEHHMKKGEVKEYVDLKLESTDVKLDNISQSLEELKETVKELSKAVRKE